MPRKTLPRKFLHNEVITTAEVQFDDSLSPDRADDSFSSFTSPKRKAKPRSREVFMGKIVKFGKGK